MFNKSKFNIDLGWNIISFVVSAIMGLLLNVLIVKVRGYDKLGLFNQVYAWYMLLSQIAVFGIHLSIQNIIPITEKIEDKKNQLVAALLLSLFTSIPLFILLKIILHNLVIIDYEEQKRVIYTLPALIFFSFNKILLSFLNGNREMKSFAIFNALRFIFMVLFLLLMFWINESTIHIFLLSELTLFTILILYLKSCFTNLNFKSILKFMNHHFNFGKNVFWGNLLLDVNTRVDIIVLGLFFSNKIVGIYSFASFFNDGFVQILLVVRNNLNPILSKVFQLKNRKLFKKVINSSIKKSYKYFSIFGILLIIIFPVGLFILDLMDNWQYVWLLFTLLIISSLISSGYFPLYNIFNQLGKPREQSLFYFYIFMINLIIDIITIPFIGLFGAILGVFASNIFSIYYCKKQIVKYSNS